MTSPLALSDDLGERLNNSIRIQMRAYPDDWSEADKREMAIIHLGYAEAASICPVERITETEIGA